MNAMPSSSFSYRFYSSWYHMAWNVPWSICVTLPVVPSQDLAHPQPTQGTWECWRCSSAAGPALPSCSQNTAELSAPFQLPVRSKAQLCEHCWGKWTPAHTDPVHQRNKILRWFHIVLFKCITLLSMYMFDVFDRKMETTECEYQGKITKEEYPGKN